MGGKLKQKNQRRNMDTLGIFQGWNIAICYPDSMRFCPLWNTPLCFCLLEMSQVTDFHQGLEVFFCFLNSFQGPSQGSFQFPLCDDSSALGWLLSNISHTSKPLLPLLSNSLTVSLQPCTSLPC